jgi:hypothetical protein
MGLHGLFIVYNLIHSGAVGIVGMILLHWLYNLRCAGNVYLRCCESNSVSVVTMETLVSVA